MDRALFILANDVVRQRVIDFVRRAPQGYRVVIQAVKRTTEQNDRMWAMLGDVARHLAPDGRYYTDEEWKCRFMRELGHEVRFLPELEGGGMFPIGFRSSKLSKQEMSDLMELISAWAARHGIELGGNTDATELGKAA